jgi:hypothetical protein
MKPEGILECIPGSSALIFMDSRIRGNHDRGSIQLQC